MDLSLVIAARDEARTLGHTLSNLRQSASGCSFEVIVVDDASEKPLSGSVSGFPITWVRNERRLGVAKSRNIGAARAKGRVLAFLDAHVCFEAGWLRALARDEGLLRNGLLAPKLYNLYRFDQFAALAGLRVPWAMRLGLLLGSRRIHYGYAMELRPRPTVVPNYRRASKTAFAAPIAGAAALFVSRELFHRLGRFEDELSGFGNFEDAELSLRCWALGYGVMVSPSWTCFHYYEPHKAHPEQPAANPWDEGRYDGSTDNLLRLMLLHFPEGELRRHPGLAPRIGPLLTEALIRRRAFIDERRVRERVWVLRRLAMGRIAPL